MVDGGRMDGWGGGWVNGWMDRSMTDGWMGDDGG